MGAERGLTVRARLHFLKTERCQKTSQLSNKLRHLVREPEIIAYTHDAPKIANDSCYLQNVAHALLYCFCSGRNGTVPKRTQKTRRQMGDAWPVRRYQGVNMQNTKTVEVKLSQAELAVLERISDPGLRAQTEQVLLSAKQASQAEVNERRNTFRVKINENKNAVIYGLGNRFPLGLRKDMWEGLKAHSAEIDAAFASVK